MVSGAGIAAFSAKKADFGRHEQFRGVFGAEPIQALLFSSYAELAARATIDRWLVVGAERFSRQRLRALAQPDPEPGAGQVDDQQCERGELGDTALGAGILLDATVAARCSCRP